MCSRRSTTYHDRTGKFLFAAQEGLSEPEDWAASERQERKLTDGLTRAEYYACDDPKTARLPPPAPKEPEVRIN